MSFTSFYKMRLDTSHAHSVDAVNALNKALSNRLDELSDHFYQDIFYLICTEWADDNNLKEFAELIEADQNGTK
jgi:hypothetical protein